MTVGTNTCSHSKKGNYSPDFNVFNISTVDDLTTIKLGQTLKERLPLAANAGGDADSVGDSVVDGDVAGDGGSVGECQ